MTIRCPNQGDSTLRRTKTKKRRRRKKDNGNNNTDDDDSDNNDDKDDENERRRHAPHPQYTSKSLDNNSVSAMSSPKIRSGPKVASTSFFKRVKLSRKTDRSLLGIGNTVIGSGNAFGTGVISALGIQGKIPMDTVNLSASNWGT